MIGQILAVLLSAGVVSQFIAAGVTIRGRSVTKRKEDETRCQEAKKMHIQRQIEELYSQLLGLFQ